MLQLKKYKSFTLKQAGYKFLTNNEIIIQKQKYRYFKSRDIEGKIKTLTVKRDEVAERTDAKVTASGGIARLDDLRAIRGLESIGVDSAILGKSLYARAFTLREALEAAR